HPRLQTPPTHHLATHSRPPPHLGRRTSRPRHHRTRLPRHRLDHHRRRPARQHQRRPRPRLARQHPLRRPPRRRPRHHQHGLPGGRLTPTCQPHRTRYLTTPQRQSSPPVPQQPQHRDHPECQRGHRDRGPEHHKQHEDQRHDWRLGHPHTLTTTNGGTPC